MRTFLVPLLALSLVLPPTHAGAVREEGDAAVKTVVAGADRFALELYAQLRGREGNLFFSPTSLSTALAMAHAGARGATAEQMEKVLHFGLPREEVPAAFAALREALHGRDGAERPYQLTVANRLWGKKGYHFLPDFLAVTRDAFGAELAEVDFAQEAEARRTINDWVADQTAGKIRDLIGPGILTPRTPLVLTNAVYFKGRWAEPFTKSLTKDQPFHLAPGRDVTVPLMHRSDHYRIMAADGLKALELPYAGGDLSMVVLLPDAVDGLPALEGRLTAEALDGWLGQLRSQRVLVDLPRFRTEGSFSLKDPLKALGMTLPFDERAADFSGITSQEELYIDAALHKAYVDVNEEGTEAAAATALVFAPRAARIEPPPISFRADHPFVFLIRHNRTGAILFLGRVVNPS